MDPGTAIGLVDSIFHFTATVVSYVSGVKNSNKERAKLASEAASLLDLFVHLRRRLEGSNASDLWFKSFVPLSKENAVLNWYKKSIEELEGYLRPGDKSKEWSQKLSWPLIKPNFMHTVDTIERLKKILLVAIKMAIYKCLFMLLGRSSEKR